jgi:hypothetical protein
MSENDGWRAQLPDDLKGHEAFTGFEKIGDFANDYLSMKGSVSELNGKLDNAIPKLNENSTAEDRAAYLKAIGRPDDINGYNIQKPEDLPDSLPFNEEVVNQFKTTAHELGLSPEQAEGLYKWYMDGTIGAHNADIESRSNAKLEVENKIKSEWGTNYDKNIGITLRAVQKFGGDEFKKYLDDTGMGNDPMLIKTFYEIGKVMSEDTLVLGDKGATDLKRGPDGRVIFEYPNSPDLK